MDTSRANNVPRGFWADIVNGLRRPGYRLLLDDSGNQEKGVPEWARSPKTILKQWMAKMSSLKRPGLANYNAFRKVTTALGLLALVLVISLSLGKESLVDVWIKKLQIQEPDSYRPAMSLSPLVEKAHEILVTSRLGNTIDKAWTMVPSHGWFPPLGQPNLSTTCLTYEVSAEASPK